MKSRKVWYKDVLWNVVKDLRPNKHDHYLVLTRVVEEEGEYHDGEKPVDYCVIDVNNEEFHPDSKPVRELYEQLKALVQEQDKLKKELEGYWLAAVVPEDVFDP